MHNRALHDTLAAFVEEAAWQLAEEVSGGAEIPFELIDAGPSQLGPLYCYRPLTQRFLAERAGALGAAALVRPGRPGAHGPARPARLPARPRPPPAGLRRPLAGRRRAAGVPRRDVGGRDRLHVRRPALRRRVRRARGGRLRRLRAVARRHAGRRARDRVRRGRARRRADARARRRRCRTRRPSCAATSSRRSPCSRSSRRPATGASLEQAGRRLRRLQTALRLWDDAEPALGPTAWARTDGAPWLAIPLATGLRRTTGDCLLAPEEEDPLRAFCSLVARRTPRSGELAWALRRFELGCERGTALEALTDWLLCARALLAEPDAVGYERMAERMAAICARPSERDELVAGLRRAIAMERAVVAGIVRPSRPSRRSSPRSAPACARSCATSSAGTSTRSCAGSPTSCSPTSRRRRPNARYRAGRASLAGAAASSIVTPVRGSRGRRAARAGPRPTTAARRRARGASSAASSRGTQPSCIAAAVATAIALASCTLPGSRRSASGRPGAAASPRASRRGGARRRPRRRPAAPRRRAPGRRARGRRRWRDRRPCTRRARPRRRPRGTSSARPTDRHLHATELVSAPSRTRARSRRRRRRRPPERVARPGRAQATGARRQFSRPACEADRRRCRGTGRRSGEATPRRARSTPTRGP